MVARGVHYAITTKMAARLDPERPHTNADVLAFIDFLDGQFHALLPEGWVQETDKAWDAIHRCMTDGTLEEGDTPGHLCVLGVTDYFWVVRDDGQVEWIVNLLDPDDVRRAAAAIRGIDRAELRRRYEGIDAAVYYRFGKSEDDFEYTWSWFPQLQAFFQRAVDAGRWVVFLVDQ
jgi:Domain of unknown function (DUF1877)